MRFLRKIILVVIILLLSLFDAARSNDPITFYYFFPDSVQSNFSLLTQEMHNFFAGGEFGNHFQAFTHEVDFNRITRERKPGMVLVPSWYYDRYGSELGLQPLLTALNKDSSNYTKVLLSRKKTGTGNLKLSGKTVAVTNMGPDTSQQLARYFNKEKLDFSTSNIIITPKDADAYYALVLGQVDAAVVGRTTIQAVNEANPRFQEFVQEIAVSGPIPMPLLCVIKGVMAKKQIDRIKSFFLESGELSPPPSFMQMLHISGWENGYM